MIILGGHGVRLEIESVFSKSVWDLLQKQVEKTEISPLNGIFHIKFLV